MTSIEDRLNSGYPQAWMPAKADSKQEKPAEMLIGVVSAVDLRGSDYGDPYVLLTVRRADGSELAWHAFHSIARAEIQREQPQVGERVGIGYFGTGPSGKAGMAGPQIYKLIVERDESRKFDYSQAGDEQSEDVAPEAVPGDNNELSF